MIKEYQNLINAVENDLNFASNNSMLRAYYDNYVQSLENADAQIKEYESTYEALKNQPDSETAQSQAEQAKLQLDSAKGQKESLKTSFLLEVNQKIDSLKRKLPR